MIIQQQLSVYCLLRAQKLKLNVRRGIMKRSEKAYLIVTLVYSLLWSAVCVFWVHKFLSGAERPVSGIIAALNVVMTAGLFVPSIAGLKSKRLTLGGSIVQFVFLIMSMYGIPIAIWGIVLLRRSLKTQTTANNQMQNTGTNAPDSDL